MNEQFRVAQKIGLMFRPGTAIPKDIKAWAISQLHANSPALGVSGKSGEVKPYPKSLEPSLELRVELHRKHDTARKEIDEKFKGDGSPEEKRARNLIDELYIWPFRMDESKFAHSLIGRFEPQNIVLYNCIITCLLAMEIDDKLVISGYILLGDVRTNPTYSSCFRFNR